MDTRAGVKKVQPEDKLGEELFEVSYRKTSDVMKGFTGAYNNVDIDELRRALREAISPGCTLKSDTLSSELDTRAKEINTIKTIQATQVYDS